MEPFTTLEAIAAPWLRANVDTDTIIRGGRSALTAREDLGRYAFEAVRLRPDGSEDPEFVLNRKPFRGAKILIAGENFGCGSSRESAVWAIAGLGIRCVIAPSFGEIFHGNCFQNGILAIRLPVETVRRLGQSILNEPHSANLSVDLPRQILRTAAGELIAFDYDPYRKSALIEGLDDIGMTMKLEATIAAFEAADRESRPWAYLTEREGRS